MPGNPLDIQDFAPVLKNYYLPYRKNVFPINTVLLAQSKKFGADKVEYAGNDLFFDVKVDRRGGFVSSAKGFYPNAKNAREKQGRLSIARTYATVSVDGLALKATENSKGSYISAAKKIVDDVMDQWEIEQERILQGDSLGIRATVTVVNSTLIVLPILMASLVPVPAIFTLLKATRFLSRDSTGATHRGKAVISLGGISPER
jgi:hypothetical protein